MAAGPQLDRSLAANCHGGRRGCRAPGSAPGRRAAGSPWARWFTARSSWGPRRTRLRPPRAPPTGARPAVAAGTRTGPRGPGWRARRRPGPARAHCTRLGVVLMQGRCPEPTPSLHSKSGAAGQHPSARPQRRGALTWNRRPTPPPASPSVASPWPASTRTRPTPAPTARRTVLLRRVPNGVAARFPLHVPWRTEGG